MQGRRGHGPQRRRGHRNDPEAQRPTVHRRRRRDRHRSGTRSRPRTISRTRAFIRAPRTWTTSCHCRMKVFVRRACASPQPSTERVITVSSPPWSPSPANRVPPATSVTVPTAGRRCTEWTRRVLVRLALEGALAGSSLHAVAESGIPTRAIAEAIGTGLGLPVVAIARENAAEHFGWMGRFFGANATASNTHHSRAAGLGTHTSQGLASQDL